MADEKRVRVGSEDFIRGWQTSETVTEVAEKTGLKVPSVLARASKYRSLGINLKSMRRLGGPRLDIEKAKAFAASLVTENVTTETTKTPAENTETTVDNG